MFGWFVAIFVLQPLETYYSRPIPLPTGPAVLLETLQYSVYQMRMLLSHCIAYEMKTSEC